VPGGVLELILIPYCPGTPAPVSARIHFLEILYRGVWAGSRQGFLFKGGGDQHTTRMSTYYYLFRVGFRLAFRSSLCRNSLAFLARIRRNKIIKEAGSVFPRNHKRAVTSLVLRSKLHRWHTGGVHWGPGGSPWAVQESGLVYRHLRDTGRKGSGEPCMLPIRPPNGIWTGVSRSPSFRVLPGTRLPARVPSLRTKGWGPLSGLSSLRVTEALGPLAG